MPEKFNPSVEATYADGRREKSQMTPIKEGEDPRERQKTSSKVREIFVPKFLDEMAKRGEIAPEKMDYFNGVAQQAEDVLGSDSKRSFDVPLYADVLALLGERIDIAERVKKSNEEKFADPATAASSELTITSGKKLFEQIAKKLFPDVVKPTTIDEGKTMVDSMVRSLLSNKNSLPHRIIGLDLNKVNLSLSPDKLVSELQSVSRKLTGQIGVMSGLERGGIGGVESKDKLDVVDLGRALYTLNSVIDQMQEEAYGRKDVTSKEAAWITAAKAKAESRYVSAGKTGTEAKPAMRGVLTPEEMQASKEQNAKINIR